MAATLYALEAVEQTVNNWIEAGGEISTVEEGVLGWGLTICHNKMPKKYLAMLKNMEGETA